MILIIGNWKSKIKGFVTKLPNDGRTIKSFYRAAKLLKYKFKKNATRLLHGSIDFNPEKILWINPEQIKFYTNYTGAHDLAEPPKIVAERRARQDFRPQVFDRDKDKGKIYDGDWDVSDLRFSQLEIYKALKLRINSGTDWEQTEFYKLMIARISDGDRIWACETEAAFKQHCGYLDRLIQSIKDRGYRLNSEVVIEGDDPHSLAKHQEYSSEVLVNIGRYGDYLFQDGRHRLAIAKILGIDSIPVKVLVRHSKWHATREQFSREVVSPNLDDVCVELFKHPDLKK